MELTGRYAARTPYLKKLSWFDWIFALLLAIGSVAALRLYGGHMDAYEKGFLLGALVVFTLLGWNWKPLRVLLFVVAVLSLTGISQYQGNLARAGQVFWLKYFLSSQSAVMWMSALFVMATAAYWLAFFARSAFVSDVASALTWSALTMGLTGMMVR